MGIKLFQKFLLALLLCISGSIYGKQVFQHLGGLKKYGPASNQIDSISFIQYKNSFLALQHCGLDCDRNVATLWDFSDPKNVVTLSNLDRHTFPDWDYSSKYSLASKPLLRVEGGRLKAYVLLFALTKDQQNSFPANFLTVEEYDLSDLAAPKFVASHQLGNFTSKLWQVSLQEYGNNFFALANGVEKVQVFKKDSNASEFKLLYEDTDRTEPSISKLYTGKFGTFLAGQVRWKRSLEKKECFALSITDLGKNQFPESLVSVADYPFVPDPHGNYSQWCGTTGVTIHEFSNVLRITAPTFNAYADPNSGKTPPLSNTFSIVEINLMAAAPHVYQSKAAEEGLNIPEIGFSLYNDVVVADHQLAVGYSQGKNHWQVFDLTDREARPIQISIDGKPIPYARDLMTMQSFHTQDGEYIFAPYNDAGGYNYLWASFYFDNNGLNLQSIAYSQMSISGIEKAPTPSAVVHPKYGPLFFANAIFETVGGRWLLTSGIYGLSTF